MVAITGLADLGNYQHCLRLNLESPAVPVEFFDDPAHAPDRPLRHPASRRRKGEHHAVGDRDRRRAGRRAGRLSAKDAGGAQTSGID
jgi:hypothetical protein